MGVILVGLQVGVELGKRLGNIKAFDEK